MEILIPNCFFLFNVVQLVSHVRLFEIQWTAACQSSLSSAIPLSLSRLISFESLILTNHLILHHPFLLLPSIFHSIRVFSTEIALPVKRSNYGVLASASVLPMNIQGWFPLGLTLIFLHSKRLSRVFSSTTIGKHQFFSAQPSLWYNSYICTWLLENL